MNPLLVEAIGSGVRAVLQILAGWLVAHGIWTHSDAEKYVAAGAFALISFGWSLWQKYRMRSKLLAAMAMPAGASEVEVLEAVKNPLFITPPISQRKHEPVDPLTTAPLPGNDDDDLDDGAA